MANCAVTSLEEVQEGWVIVVEVVIQEVEEATIVYEIKQK
jgi:hypothetical protein